MTVSDVENKELSSQLTYYQSKLLPYAYGIIGDVMEAEDVVQDVLNGYFLNPHDHVEKEENYLIRSVINRAINQKKLLRSRMETYPGQWLPTPVFTEESMYAALDKSNILNYSLLVLLEQLSPKERAVFILKESYDFSHVEIAEILGTTIESSRQLLKRSKEKIEPGQVHAAALGKEDHDMLNNLTNAILHADVEKVKHLLSAEIKTISDGGTKVNAARNIIIGKDSTYKLLRAIHTKYWPSGTSTTYTTINHKPAIVYSENYRIFRCIIFEITQQFIERIYIVVNPDKLIHLKIGN